MQFAAMNSTTFISRAPPPPIACTDHACAHLSTGLARRHSGAPAFSSTTFRTCGNTGNRGLLLHCPWGELREKSVKDHVPPAFTSLPCSYWEWCSVDQAALCDCSSPQDSETARSAISLQGCGVKDEVHDKSVQNKAELRVHYCCKLGAPAAY